MTACLMGNSKKSWATERVVLYRSIIIYENKISFRLYKKMWFNGFFDIFSIFYYTKYSPFPNIWQILETYFILYVICQCTISILVYFYRRQHTVIVKSLWFCWFLFSSRWNRHTYAIAKCKCFIPPIIERITITCSRFYKVSFIQFMQSHMLVN